MPPVLLLSAVAAFAEAPNLSGIAYLAGDAAIGPAAGGQWSPSIASGGGGFLAAWVDLRAPEAGGDIYASRIDSAGSILDSIPIAIALDAAHQSNPRVAWNGENWLVAWTSEVQREGFYTHEIRAARVSPGGLVLDDPPIAVFTLGNAGATTLGVASDGASWCLVWHGSVPGDGDVRAARISPVGAALDPGGVIVLAETTNPRAALDLAFASSTYLLVWQERRNASEDVMAIRLSPTLEPLDLGPSVVSGDPFASEVAPQVASDGSGFYVAWESFAGIPPAGEVRATRVTASGQILEPGGRSISGDVGATTGRSPCVAWDGECWFVAWKTPAISVARVSPDGDVLAPGSMPIDSVFAAGEEQAEIAASPMGGARVAWVDYRAGGADPGDIYTAAIGVDGVPSSGACLSLGAPRQRAPRIASDGARFLAAFLSERSGETRILVEPFDSGGAPLLPEPVVGGCGARLSVPGRGTIGSHYLVVWGDATTDLVRARRCLPDATFLDSAAVTVMPGRDPDVAALGVDFVVVATHAPADPNLRYPFSRRVRSADGALLDPAPVLLGQHHAVAPRACALGNRCLVVWERHSSSADPQSIVSGSFVGGDGGASAEFLVFEDPTKTRSHRAPAVASAGSCALAVWTDRAPGEIEWNILARRILPDGSLLDSIEIPVSVAVGSQDRPAVMWDGTEFLVAYDDKRANTFFLDMRSDVFATRVGIAGQVLDPAGFPIAESLLPQTSAGVAACEDARAALAFADFVAGAPFAAFRIGVRTYAAAGGPPLETGVESAAAPAPPGALLAWPNPARDGTTLAFRNERVGPVSAIVYDVAGRVVRRLLEGDVPAGPIRILWDGCGADGREVAPGLYVARVRAGGSRLSAKIVRR